MTITLQITANWRVPMGLIAARKVLSPQKSLIFYESGVAFGLLLRSYYFAGWLRTRRRALQAIVSKRADQ